MTATVADMITEPGVYDIPASVYHADPIPAGSLSSSGARKLLPPYCPAIYRWQSDHPADKETSDALDFGIAAHQLVLGDLEDRVTVIDAPDWRTSSARQQRDEAREADLTPILTKDWQRIVEMADAIRRNPVAAKLLQPGSGKPEQSLVWNDTDSNVWRRARLDWMPDNKIAGRYIVPDFKTAISAHPETWVRSAANYGYHQQAAWYLDGIKALGIDDEPVFVFIVTEKNPPYITSVIQLDDTAISLGRTQNLAALNVFAECQKTGKWPDHTGRDIAYTSLPEWFLRHWGEDTE